MPHPEIEMSAYEQQKYEDARKAKQVAYFEPMLLGDCVHCGERVWGHDDPGECAHGIAHGQCMADNGCEVA